MTAITRVAGQPDPEFCVGRDDLCRSIVKGAIEHGSALLFGGRQSGKSTVLRRIELLHREARDVLPIYVDMLKLPSQATGSDVFNFLLNRSASLLNVGFEPLKGLVDVDRFASELDRQLGAANRSADRVVFLLDEAKRLTSDECRRGLQDNLFALLYGDTCISGRCAMVFAGAQDLYSFCADLTSPIGSRAAFFRIENLERTYISEILTLAGSGEPTTELVDRVSRLAGGQAGLTVRLAVRAEEIGPAEYGAALEREKTLNVGLLRTWVTSLTDEARTLQDRVLREGELPVGEAPAILQKYQKDRFAADRAIDELVYTGVGKINGNRLQLVNEIYVAYARDFVLPAAETNIEKSAWVLVEETEVALRVIVRKKYDIKWPGTAQNKFRTAIGEDAWNRLLDNKRRGEKAYRYSQSAFNDEYLDFAYLGQLAQMIVNRDAWDLFKHLFRDKRQLEDLVADITPVRNDHAHFRRVPERELLRCRLRCEDLLYMLEQDV